MCRKKHILSHQKFLSPLCIRNQNFWTSKSKTEKQNQNKPRRHSHQHGDWSSSSFPFFQLLQTNAHFSNTDTKMWTRPCSAGASWLPGKGGLSRWMVQTDISNAHPQKQHTGLGKPLAPLPSYTAIWSTIRYWLESIPNSWCTNPDNP